MWTGQDFGDQLPSQAWKGRVLGCYIADETGLRNPDAVGVENIAWECDYPHSDCTWPTAPEMAMKEFQPTGCPDAEIDAITWGNAAKFFSFDPVEHRTREECTVGALRALAADVDTTPKSFGKRREGKPEISQVAGPRDD